MTLHYSFSYFIELTFKHFSSFRRQIFFQRFFIGFNSHLFTKQHFLQDHLFYVFIANRKGGKNINSTSMNKAEKIAIWPCMTAKPLYFCKYFFLKLEALLGIRSIKDFKGPVAN